MSLLKELAGHPEWMRLQRAADDLRPTVPPWDSNTDNTDDWKHKSSMQQGFDLCLAIFRPGLTKEKK